ncbi:thioredoxin domain-containing protein [Streptomyces violascens]|uniref:hypothetical protein n=1 Tax=Streptomyces violascens TaxID=67381 RepID=UPI0036519DB1
MVPSFHRTKGGGPLLGATMPGQIGPFGPYSGMARDAGSMEIEVWVVPDCPNERPMAERLHRALDDIGLSGTAVTVRVIAGRAEAERVGFTGSPTILIDGRDPFAEPGRVPGLACRVYRTLDGLAGVPAVEQLRQALHAAAGG